MSEKLTPAKVQRSMSGLREELFQTLEGLRAGNIEPLQAKTAAVVAMTIIKSVEVQVEFERMRLESEVPGKLPDMKLVPPLDDAPALPNKAG